jgi:hypothetical protein
MNYQKSIHIKSSKPIIFRSLSHELADWWGNMDNPINIVGDIFKVSWGEPWYQFKVITYKPYEELSWECIDSNQIIGDLEGVEKEWVGTKLHWKIKQIDTETNELTFVHEGLIPDFICYDVCSNAWSDFIGTSLKEYLEKTKNLNPS